MLETERTKMGVGVSLSNGSSLDTRVKGCKIMTYPLQK